MWDAKQTPTRTTARDALPPRPAPEMDGRGHHAEGAQEDVVARLVVPAYVGVHPEQHRPRVEILMERGRDAPYPEAPVARREDADHPPQTGVRLAVHFIVL